MFKITSRFYVIYGDGIPIYVGYTNRTVKQRFREHKISKDFSYFDGVRVEELKKEKLVYEFTWDYEQTCKNADEVSLREGQLVQKFGTQDSIYQKADGGGQTWASEKWFVRSNKDNPKFIGMSTSDIKRLLDRDKRVGVWLSTFVGSQLPDDKRWIRSFVYHQKDVEERWINSFVIGQRSTKEIWINSFVSTQKEQKEFSQIFLGTLWPITKLFSQRSSTSFW